MTVTIKRTQIKVDRRGILVVKRGAGIRYQWRAWQCAISDIVSN